VFNGGFGNFVESKKFGLLWSWLPDLYRLTALRSSAPVVFTCANDADVQGESLVVQKVLGALYCDGGQPRQSPFGCATTLVDEGVDPKLAEASGSWCRGNSSWYVVRGHDPARRVRVDVAGSDKPGGEARLQRELGVAFSRPDLAMERMTETERPGPAAAAAKAAPEVATPARAPRVVAAPAAPAPKPAPAAAPQVPAPPPPKRTYKDIMREAEHDRERKQAARRAAAAAGGAPPPPPPPPAAPSPPVPAHSIERGDGTGFDFRLKVQLPGLESLELAELDVDATTLVLRAPEFALLTVALPAAVVPERVSASFSKKRSQLTVKLFALRLL
jgi:hypothetical protein